jgi:hypothetical protein
MLCRIRPVKWSRKLYCTSLFQQWEGIVCCIVFIRHFGLLSSIVSSRIYFRIYFRVKLPVCTACGRYWILFFILFLWISLWRSYGYLSVWIFYVVTLDNSLFVEFCLTKLCAGSLCFCVGKRPQCGFTYMRISCMRGWSPLMLGFLVYF